MLFFNQHYATLYQYFYLTPIGVGQIPHSPIRQTTYWKINANVCKNQNNTCINFDFLKVNK